MTLTSSSIQETEGRRLIPQESSRVQTLVDMPIKPKHLSTKIALICSCIIFILTLLYGFLLMENIKKATIKTIADFTMEQALSLTKQIDSETYASFLKNPKENEIYWKLRNQLNEYRELTGAMFIYTLQVNPNNIVIMIDGQPKGSKVAASIGELTSATTNEHVAPVLQGKLNSTEMVHDPKYGEYVSGFAPIEDNAGRVIGILGIDTESSKVYKISRSVILYSLPIFLIASALFMSIALFIIIRYLYQTLMPLQIIQESADLISQDQLDEAVRKIDKEIVVSRDEIGNLFMAYRNMVNRLFEVKQLREDNEKLNTISLLDGLTGIGNRRCFDQTLEQEWKAAIRNHTPISLIMIDIDYFKKYNDTYGHLNGDTCLRTIAKTLAGNVQLPYLVARYGGEEFAVILPESNLNNAALLGETLRSSVESLGIPHRASEIGPDVTISVGAACLMPTPDLNSQQQLISLADKALYHSKLAGRNQVTCIDENANI